MTTHISKIARLPKPIRNELNTRLENGELGRTILNWVNNLPDTKKTLAELFNAKPITHQNLSEWRRTGYQDWLNQQLRLNWFTNLSEEDQELDQRGNWGDSFEAMGNIFLFEIGQAMTAMQHVKNPDARWTRLQHLSREFARLQNAFNWSRRVLLEWHKYNGIRVAETRKELPQPPAQNSSPQNHQSAKPESVTKPESPAIPERDRAHPGRSDSRPRDSQERAKTPENLISSEAPASIAKLVETSEQTISERSGIPGRPTNVRRLPAAIRPHQPTASERFPSYYNPFNHHPGTSTLQSAVAADLPAATAIATAPETNTLSPLQPPHPRPPLQRRRRLTNPKPET